LLQLSTGRWQLRKLGGEGTAGILARNTSREWRVGRKKVQDPEQLEFSFSERKVSPAPAQALLRPGPGLRVIRGGGTKAQEKLGSRDAVVRVLVEAGADLLLRRITPERAEHIERSVSRILDLFDRVDATPSLMPALQHQLDELEALMRETRASRGRPVAAGRTP
jgi:hypothetical protein